MLILINFGRRNQIVVYLFTNKISAVIIILKYLKIKFRRKKKLTILKIQEKFKKQKKKERKRKLD